MAFAALLFLAAPLSLGAAAVPPEAPLPPASNDRPADPFLSTAPPPIEITPLAVSQGEEELPVPADSIAASETIDPSPSAAKLREAIAINDSEARLPNASDAPPPQPRTNAYAALQAIGALCVVIALILLLSWALRKYGKNAPIFAHAKLGQLLGRIYLDRNACLYYVRTGGRVLAIGATRNGLSLIAEFDEAAFDLRAPQSEIAPSPRLRFVDYLKASAQRMERDPDRPPIDDADLASLRGDIQRLQERLRETAGDSKE